jgi:hypothetical protein
LPGKEVKDIRGKEPLELESSVKDGKIKIKEKTFRSIFQKHTKRLRPEILRESKRNLTSKRQSREYLQSEFLPD